MTEAETYMYRCLELARNGMGHVAPNPLVGCVIAHDGNIIGEGYHRKYGEAHAEVNAIQSVENQELLKNATLYVNLEPCSHWGKTPPCADLIIAKQIPQVVIGCQDIYEEVNGRGIARLRDAGIHVETAVLERECRELNKRFFVFNAKKRPYIILKWAKTTDGFIAREDYSSQWISNPYSRLMVHLWRSEEAAIMVGTNTALHDNPQLSSRDMRKRNPVRIIFDSEGKLPITHHIFDGSQPTIVFTEFLKESKNNLDFVKIDFSSPASLAEALTYLWGIGIQSIMVEGGAALLQSFINQGIWDEAMTFDADNVYFKSGVAAPFFDREPETIKRIGTDILRIYRNKAAQ